MSDRLLQLRSLLKEKKIYSMFLSSPLSISYYTGFSGFALEEREGYALVTQKHSYIITSKLYEGAVQSLGNQTIAIIYSSSHPFSKVITEIITQEKLHSFGVEANDLTLAEYTSCKKLCKIVPLSIKHLRVKKTKEEIQAIQKACQIADKACEKMHKQIRSGMSEKEIARLLKRAIEDQGAEISFRPIVAFGKNAAIPHHLTSEKTLKANDLILIDFGAKVDGYCSDMTRTFFFGKPTDEQKKVYNAVLNAQRKAIDYVYNRLIHYTSSSLKKEIPSRRSLLTKKEIKANTVDKVARDYIISQGFPTIPHSLGHGIGLEVHEPPHIGPNSEDVLTEAMVFSIEPGIYLPNKFGVRIEDLFTIQDGKLLQLTKASKI